MKILLCSEYFYPKIGGVEKHTEIIADYFTNKNHHVQIATSFLKLYKNIVNTKPYIINCYSFKKTFTASDVNFGT